MRITQEDDYALRVVLYLYRNGMNKRVEARAISEHEKIPLRFLLKLLRKLASADIIRSFRGTGGGYSIEKPPSQVSIRDIIEAIEGPVYINKCMYDQSLCNLNRANTCCIHKTLENIQRRITEELENANFEEILKVQ